jgi:hypothetical protein
MLCFIGLEKDCISIDQRHSIFNAMQRAILYRSESIEGRFEVDKSTWQQS